MSRPQRRSRHRDPEHRHKYWKSFDLSSLAAVGGAGGPPGSGDPPGPGDRISGREAPDILRAYQPQIAAWARKIIVDRVRGTLRQRALNDIASEVQSEVAEQFILAARQGRVFAACVRGFLFRLTERTAMRMVNRRWRYDKREVDIERSEAANDNAEGADPESLLLEREHNGELAALLGRANAALVHLPARDRRLIEARTAERPVPFELLAQELTMTAEAARVAFFRAIRKLRGLLLKPAA